MLVFISLAASALLAAVAFGIAGRTTQFNYSVNEAELQYENIYEVIQDTADELTLDEIYRYILYPAAGSDREYFIADSEGRVIYPQSIYNRANQDEQAAIDFISENLTNEEAWTDHLTFMQQHFYSHQTLLMKFKFNNNDRTFYIIQYTIINESSETRKVATWEITRVPNEGGLIFFEAPVDSIWPAGLMNFQQAFEAAWYQPDEASENRKVNADGQGWLAYCSNGLLLVKRFEDLNPSQPAPNEAEIQVYVNRGKTYIELESQGAYTTLQPNGQLTWTVRWYLQPCDAEPQPSASLLQQAKKVK